MIVGAALGTTCEAVVVGSVRGRGIAQMTELVQCGNTCVSAAALRHAMDPCGAGRGWALGDGVELMLYGKHRTHVERDVVFAPLCCVCGESGSALRDPSTGDAHAHTRASINGRQASL